MQRKVEPRASLFRENALYHCYYTFFCIFQLSLFSLCVFFCAMFRFMLHFSSKRFCFVSCCSFIAVALVIYYHFFPSIQVVSLLELLNVFCERHTKNKATWMVAHTHSIYPTASIEGSRFHWMNRTREKKILGKFTVSMNCVKNRWNKDKAVSGGKEMREGCKTRRRYRKLTLVLTNDKI